MQCIYALTQSEDDSLERQQKFLNSSIAKVYTLYLLLLNLLIELHQLAKKHADHAEKKYLSDDTHYTDNKRFVNNKLLHQLLKNEALKKEIAKRKLYNWYLNPEYIKILYQEMLKSEVYTSYMQAKHTNFHSDKIFIINLYKEVIAPNDKIYDHLEDDQITWIDDIPIVNTFLVKRLKNAKPDSAELFYLPKLLKDDQDMVFAKDLLVKTLLNNAEWESEIQLKTGFSVFPSTTDILFKRQ